MHTDGQLWATHIILNYDPILSSFQALKYMIKAKDPCLQQIKIVVPSFLVGTLLEGAQPMELPFQRTAEEEATSSLPVSKVIAKVAEVSDYEEDFEVFNQP